MNSYSQQQKRPPRQPAEVSIRGPFEAYYDLNCATEKCGKLVNKGEKFYFVMLKDSEKPVKMCPACTKALIHEE